MLPSPKIPQEGRGGQHVHPEHMIRNIVKIQFLYFYKILSNTSDHIKRSNEYLEFFIKESYDSYELKEETIKKKSKKPKRKDNKCLQLSLQP